VSSVFCRLIDISINLNNSGQFIFSSPWTMNLCADINGLFSGDSLSEYSSILAIKILPIGTILLHEVSSYTHMQHSVYNPDC
jgi:hypothetical protein